MTGTANEVETNGSTNTPSPAADIPSHKLNHQDKPLPQPPDMVDKVDDYAEHAPDGADTGPKQTAASVKSSSSSTESSSSTIAYEQISFNQFSIKVEELCQLLWPSTPKESRGERLLNGSSSRLIGALRGTRFRKTLPSTTPRKFMIERLEGGTFNRITGITLPQQNSEEPQQLILRTPRSEWSARPDRDVAILRYLKRYTTIPIPEVKIFDLSSSNPLNQPYVLQTRVVGYNLQRVYPNLSHDRNCTIARELGKVLIALQGVINPLPGLIESAPIPEDENAFTVRPFDIKLHHDKDWESKTQDYTQWTQDQHNKFYGTTLDFLITQFGRWRADELYRDPSGIAWWDYQHRFVGIAKEMNQLGMLSDSQNCLCHLDFAARNVMVDVPMDEPLTIAGILDWDSAVFAPKWVACAPPWWIWADDPDDDGADWDESDELRALETPPTTTGQELKRIFEDTVGDDYLHYAYEPQYRMARKLFHFAVNGLHQNEDINEADFLFEEWKEFYDNLMQRAMEEMSKSPQESDSDDELQAAGVPEDDDVQDKTNTCE